jgi:hypothetical protein
MIFSFKNNFFLRETRNGLKAFSGADQSRARLAAFIADPCAQRRADRHYEH